MPNLNYSIFPGKEIDKILNKVFKEFQDSHKKDIGDILDNNEKLFLRRNLNEIPFVRIIDNSLDSDILLTLQTNFNKYLDNLLFTLHDSKNSVDYFSIGLSQEVGNNNLEIKENNQSAAMLYTL